MSNPETLIDKIKALPQERQNEVEDFVDFLTIPTTDRALVRAASQMSTAALAAVWNNPEDDIYDSLGCI